MGSVTSQSHKDGSESSGQSTLPTGSGPTRFGAHASGLAGPRVHVKYSEPVTPTRRQPLCGPHSTARTGSGLRGRAVSFCTPTPQTRAPEPSLDRGRATGSHAVPPGGRRAPLGGLRLEAPRCPGHSARVPQLQLRSVLLFRKGTKVSQRDTRSPNVSARHTTRLSERPREPASRGGTARGGGSWADPGGAGSLGPAGGFRKPPVPRREKLPLGKELPAPRPRPRPHPRPRPRPRPSDARSRALDIRLCQQKKERNVDLPFPELLSVLFQNDITESNHEIYMGGVGGRGRGRQLPPDSVTRGEACVRVSIKRPLPSVRAPSQHGRRLIYLMTALISGGGTGWQRGSFVNTLPMNPWGSNISVYSPR